MNSFRELICLLVAVVVAVSGRSISNTSLETDQLPEVHGNKFYYFGFGSNMLAKRIHIQNPTAEFVGAGLLHDFRLDFATHSERWNGAVATIVPTPGTNTWGTIWEIDLSNLDDIDNQEGVHINYYVPLTVQVKQLGNDTEISARAYALVKQPESNLQEMRWEDVPEDRQPSKTYLQVLVKGAIESGIPADYVQSLRRIKHNNNIMEKLAKELQVDDFEL